MAGGGDGEPPGEPYFLAFPVAGLLALTLVALLVALLVGFRALIADLRLTPAGDSCPGRRVKRQVAPATRQSAN